MRRGLQPGQAELVVIMPQPVTECCQGGDRECASAATAAAQSNVSNSCASSGAKMGSSPWKPPDAASGGAAPAATSTIFAPVLLWSPSATSSCMFPAQHASFAFTPGSALSECKRGHHQAQGTTQLDVHVLHPCNMDAWPSMTQSCFRHACIDFSMVIDTAQKGRMALANQPG